MSDNDFDVIVIGSGFGGSVSALRLAEKGYRVAVLEAGRRWRPQDFPSTNWNVRTSIWAPRLGCTGPLRIGLLGTCLAFGGVGVGGGSLIYGNTLYRPPDSFFQDRQWARITDWESELDACYDQAKRMLGVDVNPRNTPADLILREVAADLGVAGTVHPTQVGVFFNEDAPGAEVEDPYFGGAGPRRTGCTHCSRCLTGCPSNAKNTTITNYLYLAEQAGVQVYPMRTVTEVLPGPDGRYTVTARRSNRGRRNRALVCTAGQIVFAAGALGTQQLLHRLRAAQTLPNLSPRLGELARSNSESIIAVTSRTRRDLADGVAITSSFHPDPHTHVEAWHYGRGQNGMFPLLVPLIDGGPHRVRRFAAGIVSRPLRYARSLNWRRSADRSIFLLTMQSVDNSMVSYLRRGRLRTRHGSGAPNPVWLPIAHDVGRRVAAKCDGDVRALATEVFDMPSTGHYIGGCVIGENPGTGVIDPYHRVFGHPGLHIIDGSAITANLGVNPSLTITALAERALSLWPNKGESDPRPPLGSDYRRIPVVAPHHPMVPADAPGAWRLAPGA